MSIRSRLIGAGVALEHAFDGLRYHTRVRLGWVRRPLIVPFRGYGTQDRLHVRGRVLEERSYHSGVTPVSLFGKLRHMYERFQSDEVPGMGVTAIYGDQFASARTDREGYFHLVLIPQQMLPPDRAWHDVKLSLDTREADAPVTAPVLVPPIDSEFGVISDIDDTIIRTSATNLWKMIRITLLSTPESRLPFKGVAAFYLALQRGSTGSAHNPLFYVSSSPWNLHDVLTRFMDVHGIPIGPLFLRDFGFTREYFFAAGHRKHKREQIERLLELYPDLNFILIGDSGQRDPEIYAQVVRDYPGRIPVVYIRDVGLEVGQQRTRALAEETRRSGVEMLLVPDTEAAALNAAARGFIREDTLPDIRAEKAKDESAAGDLVQILESATSRASG